MASFARTPGPPNWAGAFVAGSTSSFSPFSRIGSTVGATVLVAMAGLCFGSVAAYADTTIDGPVNIGTAAPFGVLGSSAVTNTGPTIVNGDVGVSPDSSITGFGGPPNGSLTGTIHKTDAVAAQAQSDVTTAFNTASSLTPTTSGIGELNGLSLTPGVYSGGALSLADNGALTLAGSATAVWVFQAASTLTIGSATHITMTGGATACNVFWRVGSSATIGTAAQFVGTVLADQSITATTGATIAGRLLASNAAVTLDTNTITAPTGCAPAGTPVTTSSPSITSGAPTASTVGTSYAFTVTASGTPAPTYTVTSGTLPAGLTLNGTTGVISGTPTTSGSSTVTITATNGQSPDASAVYTFVTAPAAVAAVPSPGGTAAVQPSVQTSTGLLADTGSNPTLPLLAAIGFIGAGIAIMAFGRRTRAGGSGRHMRSAG